MTSNDKPKKQLPTGCEGTALKSQHQKQPTPTTCPQTPLPPPKKKHPVAGSCRVNIPARSILEGQLHPKGAGPLRHLRQVGLEQLHLLQLQLLARAIFWGRGTSTGKMGGGSFFFLLRRPHFLEARGNLQVENATFSGKGGLRGGGWGGQGSTHFLPQSGKVGNRSVVFHWFLQPLPKWAPAKQRTTLWGCWGKSCDS